MGGRGSRGTEGEPTRRGRGAGCQERWGMEGRQTDWLERRKGSRTPERYEKSGAAWQSDVALIMADGSRACDSSSCAHAAQRGGCCLQPLSFIASQNVRGHCMMMCITAGCKPKSVFLVNMCQLREMQEPDLLVIYAYVARRLLLLAVLMSSIHSRHASDCL